MPRATRLPSVLLALAIATVSLVACTPDPDSTAQPTATEEPTTAATAPPALALAPDGSADENLAYFAGIVSSVWSGPEQVSGRAYVDALTSGGFDREAMQVTADQSTVGNAAESIQFAVRWGDRCLVGQVGPATGDPVTAVLPGLADGGCLVGQTRSIDW